MQWHIAPKLVDNVLGLSDYVLSTTKVDSGYSHFFVFHSNQTPEDSELVFFAQPEQTVEVYMLIHTSGPGTPTLAFVLDDQSTWKPFPDSKWAQQNEQFVDFVPIQDPAHKGDHSVNLLGVPASGKNAHTLGFIPNFDQCQTNCNITVKCLILVHHT